MEKNWKRDRLQFARMIFHLAKKGGGDSLLSVAEDMGIEDEDMEELMERAGQAILEAGSLSDKEIVEGALLSWPEYQEYQEEEWFEHEAIPVLSKDDFSMSYIIPIRRL